MARPGALKARRLWGAQAANELLDIAGMKASIVMTFYNNTIYLSARSIDEVNVQVMMEKLGGGGHRTIAGAQLKDMSLEEARNRVKEVIRDMLEKGRIYHNGSGIIRGCKNTWKKRARLSRSMTDTRETLFSRKAGNRSNSEELK